MVSDDKNSVSFSALIRRLLAKIAIGRRFWRRCLQHLMIIRVPLSAFVIYVLLERLSRNDWLPTVSNMMDTTGKVGLGVAAFSAVLSLAAIVLCGLLAWRLAHERFGIENLPLPIDFAQQPFRSAALFSLPAGLVLVRLWQGAEPGRLTRSLALAVGIGLALVILWLLAKARRAGFLQRLTGRLLPLFRLLGPGYTCVDVQGGRFVQRGHPLMIGVVAVLTAVYFLGYWLLNPAQGPEAVPTIAYVFFLLALLCQILTGVSFYLDFYRVPVLIGLILFMAASGAFFPRDHFFPVFAGSQPAPTIGQALEQRLELQPSREQPLITVVGASGGGILAAGWTAQVLTGLQEALGEEFTDSIQFLSTASGGSVGTLFFLESFDDAGHPLNEDLSTIRQGAMASSLSETAWGLVFPDLRRTVFPLGVSKIKDRAWAIERAWLQNLACMKAGQKQQTCRLKPVSTSQATRLSHWRQAAAEGRLPGVVMNATVVDDGVQFMASNLDLNSFRKESDALGEHWQRSPADPDLSQHYPKAQPLDMPVVTAARLSATFPYVTPVARARWHDESDDTGEPLPEWHIADGGYFDNFGTVAAVQWIEQAMEHLGDREPDILYIQIVASSPPELSPPRDKRGWVYSVLGPLKTILNVRSSSQRIRNDVELASLKRRFPSLEVVTFQLPASNPLAPRTRPPLSWELSAKNKNQLCLDWCHSVNWSKVEHLHQDYFPNNAAPERPRCLDSATQLSS